MSYFSATQFTETNVEFHLPGAHSNNASGLKQIVYLVNNQKGTP